MAGKKVLIVNKFLYPRGGDCIVALSEADLLRSVGYEVELWGMDYPDNLHLPLAGMFASRVEFAGNMKQKLTAARRMMGFGDIRRSFAEVLRRFKPDTVHFHNIHSYLSPVIVEMAKEAGCRTLWTMHDYKLVCPAYLCIDSSGRPCSRCITQPWSVVEHRCMKGSRSASIMARLEAMKWHVDRLSGATDSFICPSSFMSTMLVAGGFPRNKVSVICNFIDPAKFDLLSKLPADRPRERGVAVYAGRLSKEKGVETMISAFASMEDPTLTLKVFGTGPLEHTLRESYGRHSGIQINGHADATRIADEMSRAELTVCPSECYENNPLSVIESFAAGTPVLGADIGGIPELITPSSGMLFEPGSPDAFIGAIRGMLIRSWDHAAIKADAMDRFSASRHLNLLSKLL